MSDSYVRGIGLQFGNLRNIIRSDPAYQRATAMAGTRGIVSEDNRMKIFLIIWYFLPRLTFGNIMEFRLFRGGNAMFMAAAVVEVTPGRKGLHFRYLRKYAADGLHDRSSSGGRF